jgi:hypothetical protein
MALKCELSNPRSNTNRPVNSYYDHRLFVNENEQPSRPPTVNMNCLRDWISLFV